MARWFDRRTVQLAAALGAIAGSTAVAQDPVPGTAATAPTVGTMAPDFTLAGATRFGLLKEPAKLSKYRGQTVVVAFFPKARTRG